MKRVVTNTSPLIVLAKAELLHILPAIFNQVSAPEAVFREIFAGPANDPMRRALPSLRWLTQVKLDPPLIGHAQDRLGPGEAEAIEFARRNPDWAVLVDDRAARRGAIGVGLSVLGTLTMVAVATERRLVASFDHAVRELRKAGLFVTDELVDSVKTQLKTK